MSRVFHTRRDFLHLLSALGMTVVAAPPAHSWSLWGSDSPDALVGTYTAVNPRLLPGPVHIEKRGDKFLLQHSMPKVLPAGELKPISKKEFEAVFKQPMSDDIVGLAINPVVFFKVPKGWKTAGFECKTGYWLFLPFGAIELNKQ